MDSDEIKLEDEEIKLEDEGKIETDTESHKMEMQDKQEVNTTSVSNATSQTAGDEPDPVITIGEIDQGSEESRSIMDKGRTVTAGEGLLNRQAYLARNLLELAQNVEAACASD